MASARRFVVFLVVFCTGMALLVWQAGGLTGSSQERVHGARTGRSPGAVIDIEGGASMGRGEGVQIERNGVAAVDGVPYEYRAFEAGWATQEPRAGGAPGQRRLHVTECELLLFHDRPSREQPRPPAVEGPGTTHVRADVADVTMREGAEFLANLDGNVVVTRHDRQGDLVLLSDSLDCDAEHSRVRTDDAVRIEGRSACLSGTGLDADMAEPRVRLAKDVRGEFVARRGSMTTEGSDPSAEPVTTVITCDGHAELHALSEATRRAGRRWLVTFHDNVLVDDGSATLRCTKLEIEFRMAEGEDDDPSDGSADPVDVLRMVADGEVRLDASRDKDRFIVETSRAVSTREPGGAEQVLLEGGTRLEFSGRIRAREDEGDEDRGRIEIRCSGPASIYYERPEDPADAALLRARAVFERDVVARQWAPGAEAPESELRAPLVTLFATRGPSGRLEPQAMSAHGKDGERAHVRRLGLTAVADVVAWEAEKSLGLERVTLTGTPEAGFEDRSGLNPLGSGSRGADATLVVAAEDEIVVVYPRERDESGPDPAGRPDGPTASARGNVVARRMIGDTEVYRLVADRADVEFAPDRRPRQLHAYGGVVLSGRGERDGQRSAELRGSRLRANAATPAGVDDPWTDSTVLVFGEPEAPAVAIVEELPDARGVGRSHSIRAQELSYGESGTVVVARRAAEAALNSSADPGTGIDPDDPFSGPIHIRADQLRAELFPTRQVEGEARRPNLRRVSATGGVIVEGATRRITGDRAVYDHVGGVAIVSGQPARAAYRRGGAPPSLTVPTSTVTSPTIRAEFDVGPERNGELRRVSCAGGRIVGYQFPTTAPGQTPKLERITVTATGPITVDERSATASENVDVLYESRTARGGWTQDASLKCDRVELGFDPTTRGELRDRIVRAYATGSPGRPVRVVTPRFEAVASIVEGLGDWLHLRGARRERVHVTERDPIREFFCDSGSWNIVTSEWSNLIRAGVR